MTDSDNFELYIFNNDTESVRICVQKNVKYEDSDHSETCGTRVVEVRSFMWDTVSIDAESGDTIWVTGWSADSSHTDSLKIDVLSK